MGLRASYDTATPPDQAWDRFRSRALALQTNPDTQAAFLSETSAKFFELMVGAMMVSFHKYGPLAVAYPERVHAIANPESLTSQLHTGTVRAGLGLLGSFGKRLDLYLFGRENPDFGEPGEPEFDIAPGNVEYLVDAANFLAIEFMHPAHPQAHYAATDASGSPGRVPTNTLYDGQGVQYANGDLLTTDEGVTL